LTDCDRPIGVSIVRARNYLSVMPGRVRSRFTFDLGVRLIIQLIGTGAVKGTFD
jgi:hypothetical protein